jgi:dihydroorotate dehydrogenase
MADLSTNFLGIKSPNPFWLASAPPTDKAYNVERAFEAGWGGVVWKTLGEAGPPVVNVNGPRYGAIWGPDRRLLGLNNIELITDRDLETNLREIAEVKKRWPDRAMIVSIMVPCEEASWKAILPRVEDTGADGVELNFGCPHGMSERGMGSAVGQVPEYIQMVAEWCKQHSKHAGDREADAQHHRYPLPGPGSQGGRRRRCLADQHHFLDRLGRSRQFRAHADDRRQGLAWRLLRPGGQADRAQHGGRNRP